MSARVRSTLIIVLGLSALASCDAGVGEVASHEDVGGLEDTRIEIAPETSDPESVDGPEGVDGPESVDGPEGTEGPDVIDEPGGVAEVADTSEPEVGPTCPEIACAPGELCEGGVCVCDPTPVSFATEIAPLLQTGCGPGCHVYNAAVTSGSAGLNLAPHFAHAELVGVPTTQCRTRDPERLRVAPGAPARSYLVHKLEGREMCSGVRMPKGRTAWPADRIALLGRWICQGAADN